MEETRLKIRFFGDAGLRKKSHPVEAITASHREILNEMAKFMYAASGIGLAAAQVGINEAMIVVDSGSGLYKLINPRIVKKEGTQSMEEGCLSLPGICIKVKRSYKVTVKALDENGKDLYIEAEGLLACVLQHEVDHLRGKMIVDYASLWEKLKIKRQLNALRKKAQDDEELSKSGAKSCRLQM